MVTNSVVYAKSFNKCEMFIVKLFIYSHIEYGIVFSSSKESKNNDLSFGDVSLFIGAVVTDKILLLCLNDFNNFNSVNYSKLIYLK